MKRQVFNYLAAVAMSVVSLQVQAFTSEMKTIRLSDGEEIAARLCLPEEGKINTIVVAVHGMEKRMQMYLLKVSMTSKPDLKLAINQIYKCMYLTSIITI